jgi:hypothetical protein
MLTRVILNNIKNNSKKLVNRGKFIASPLTINKCTSYSTFSIRRNFYLNIGVKYRQGGSNIYRFGRTNKFYSSGKNPVPPPPRPPPRRPGKGQKRMSPAEARQAAGGSGKSGKVRNRKKPKNLGKNDQNISWLGVGAVSTVVSIGLAIAYYTQNGTEHMPSFLKKTLEYLPSFGGESMIAEDYEEPPSRLLPNFPAEQLGPGGRCPPTLVLDLEDTLVHISWDRQHGFRVAKRPGVSQFLNTLAMYYEIVIFTKMAYGGADEIIFRLDPQQFVMHKLYKNSLVKSDDGR